MKRILPVLLTLLLLTACGTAPTAPDEDPDPTYLPEGEVSVPNAASPAHAEGLDEDELPIMGGEGDAAAPSPPPRAVTVTLDGVSSYLRVTLPEAWTFETGENIADSRVIVLHPENDESFAVELHWWSSFGMCGTGVTFTDYTLPDGRVATLATEASGDSQFWTLILPESPDSFTIQICAKVSAFEAHEEELELLLGSIQQGILAGLDVVTPETSTG